MTTAGKSITCRAAVLWKAKEPYSIETVEVAPPQKGEVRVKMASAGLCHSDLLTQENKQKSWYFPTVLGHEGSGIIESVGEGVTQFQPGDIVVLAFECYCKECDYCLGSNTNLCRKQPKTIFQIDGTSRITCNGKILSQMASISTFSEYTVTSEMNAVKVNPKGNPNTFCLLGCCIPTGYGAAINVAQVKPGSTVAVWGLGGVGMCVLMGCRDSGAGRIIGIDTNPKKFELAKQFGATECLNPKDLSNIPETIARMTNGGPDVCFAAVGNVSAMEEAFQSSHPHWGKTVIIGATEFGTSIKAGVWDLLYGRQLVGTYYGGYKPIRDIPHLVDKVMSGTIQLEKLISHRLPLDKINEGYELLKSGESLRSIIDFDLKA